MIISEQWLREWVNPTQDLEALAHQLTMAGLEVEAIEAVAGAFHGVVVGEIVACEPHPNADKLRLCDVDTGQGATVPVVCGAPNARVGLRAPFAQVGAELPGGLKIRRAKLRGAESQGMLCSASELELSDDADGLMELPADAALGADLRAVLGLDDVRIEIGLTPNRADCLSIAGIARDVALLNALPVCAPPHREAPVTSEQVRAVSLEAPGRCPRYLCRVIEDVDLSRPSPLWLQEKLRRVGLRPIDAAVDVTNYLLMELGQPMHAFDLDRVQGGVVVREARAGEQITLLDGRQITLNPGNLVIADEARALALAGIMGGADSAVSAGTRHLLLESAFFAPEPMAGHARAHNLHTDSSHRFERGVDFMLQRRAMERATRLLLEIVGGRAGPITEAVGELPRPEPVQLRSARIPRLLGIDLPVAEVERCLDGLGVTARREADGWRCEVPSWRFDLRQEVDLLEELARVHGYDRLPVTPIRAGLEPRAVPERRIALSRFRAQLVGRGYHEAITYSFIEPSLLQTFTPEVVPLPVRNPISADLSAMRTTLLAGLLEAARFNSNRQQGRVRLFETGLRFRPTEAGLRQERTLALLCCGPVSDEHWSAPARSIDFYDLKGDVETLLELSGVPCRFERATRPGFHPGQCAIVWRGEQELGVIGMLHPAAQSKLELPGAVGLAELDLAVLEAARLPAFTPISRYPSVRRDIAIVVDKAVAAAELMETVRESAGSYLEDLTLFDVYAGKGIDPARKSLALGLTFRDGSRTLAEEEVAQAVEQVIDSLKKNHMADLRA